MGTGKVISVRGSKKTLRDAAASNKNGLRLSFPLNEQNLELLISCPQAIGFSSYGD